jgi:hypothetical protein
MGLDSKTYWLTDRQSQCDFDFVRQNFRQEDVVQGSSPANGLDETSTSQQN